MQNEVTSSLSHLGLTVIMVKSKGLDDLLKGPSGLTSESLCIAPSELFLLFPRDETNNCEYECLST